MLNLKTYLRFPRDGEFKEALAHRDLYQVKRLCGYTLLKLENHDHKEPISLGGLTIEHILPQTENLHPDWLAMLGPDAEQVQSRYLHTLGNLTLTGYNSELSARPFAEKRDIKGGFMDSHLRLNEDLAKLDVWNAQEIQARAAKLGDLSAEVWPFLQPSEEARARADLKGAKAGKTTRTVEDHLEGASTELRELMEDIREGLLNLHEDVTEHPLSVYIGYKVGANFCDVSVQPGGNRLRCWFNMPFGEIVDVTGRVRDVSEIGRHGNGDVEVVLRPGDDVEWFLGLARQGLTYQLARPKVDTATTGIQMALAALPEPLQRLSQQLEARVVGLGPDIKIRRNKWYYSYRRAQSFVELETRVDALKIRVRIGETGTLLPEQDRPAWSKTRWEKWWQRSLPPRTLEAAWPVLEAAYHRVDFTQTSEPPVSATPFARCTTASWSAQHCSGRTSSSRRQVRGVSVDRGDGTAACAYQPVQPWGRGGTTTERAVRRHRGSNRAGRDEAETHLPFLGAISAWESGPVRNRVAEELSAAALPPPRRAAHLSRKKK